MKQHTLLNEQTNWLGDLNITGYFTCGKEINHDISSKHSFTKAHIILATSMSPWIFCINVMKVVSSLLFTIHVNNTCEKFSNIILFPKQINGFQPRLFIMSGQAGKPFGIEAVLKKRYVTHNIVLLFIAAMCPPGYTNFPGYHCYKITPKPQPRDASLRLCQDEGSSLVALETQGEFTALRPWIEEQGD